MIRCGRLVSIAVKETGRVPESLGMRIFHRDGARVERWHGSEEVRT